MPIGRPEKENQHCPKFTAYFGADSYLESDDSLTNLLLVLLNEGASDSHDIAIWQDESKLIACVVNGELKMLSDVPLTLSSKTPEPKPVPSKPRLPRMLTYCGQTKSLTEWAKDKGLSKMCLHLRLKAGWDLATALETPVQQSNRTPDTSRTRAHKLRT